MREEEINCVCNIVTSHAGKGNPNIDGQECTCEVGHLEKAGFKVTEKIQTEVLSLEAKKFDFNPADYWDLVAKDRLRLKDGKLEGEFVIRRKVRP